MALPGEPPLEGWKDIAKHLGRSKRTVQRWKRKGLPVHRHEALGVIAYRSELDLWVKTWNPTELGSQKSRSPTPPVGPHQPELVESNNTPPVSEGLTRRTGDDEPLNSSPSSVGIIPAGGPDLGTWFRRCVFIGSGFALFSVLTRAVMVPAYGLAILAFCLGAVFVILGYRHMKDTPTARAVVAIYMVAAMSYISSASTMPDFQVTVINVTTLDPADAFLFVIGLKFIPMFILVLLFWVILAYCHDAGFPARRGLGKVYALLGVLFLLTELISLAIASGDDRVWKAVLPGRWILLIGSTVVFAVNLTVWLMGLRCFKRDCIPSYSPLFSVCAIVYLPLVVGAYFVDDVHNQVNRYYLDVRWPEPYVAAHPDAIKEFDKVLPRDLRAKVGPDLTNLLKNAEFADALRNGTFYRQHFDEPFQVRSRAVMFGYRPASSSSHSPVPFTVIRFPKELADALGFQPVSDSVLKSASFSASSLGSGSF